MKKKVGYIGGFWATNIGNSFYNIGALYLLKKIYGEKNVNFIPDPPQWHWNRINNDFKLLKNLDLDLYIISGPCLNKGLIKVYKDIFDEFKRRNKKIALISVGSSNYNEQESILVSEFLNKYEIQYVTTRDDSTYDLYKNKLKAPTFNGLCTSMFLDEAVDVPKLNNDFVVFNFSSFIEPKISLIKDEISINKGLFPFYQKDFDGHEIVRTNNESFTRNFKFFNTQFMTFYKPNTYYSDLPYGYLSILKSAKVVFSDRVHSCAAALILGNKAMYIKNAKRSKDGRNKLFKRIGVENIYTKPSSLNFKYIKDQKKLMIEFLKLHH